MAVLASGEGTNLQALLDDASLGRQVALVVSDRPQARALGRARRAGVQTVVVEPSGFQDRSSYDEALVALLEDERIDVVVLAGFMRILGSGVVSRFENRILNVHPSLLPSFPGDRSVKEALEWGVKLTGVTVHLVDDQVDHGPVVAQEAIPVLPDDDWESLETRVHEVEHRLLPMAVRAMVEGRIQVNGRTVRVEEG